MKRVLSISLLIILHSSGLLGQTIDNTNLFFPFSNIPPCLIKGDVGNNISIPFTVFSKVQLNGKLSPIDSVRIDVIENLPCGLFWNLNKKLRIYKANEKGTLTITGKIHDPEGQYKLNIILTLYTGNSKKHIAISELGMVSFVLVKEREQDVCKPVKPKAEYFTATCTGLAENYARCEAWHLDMMLNYDNEPGKNMYIFPGSNMYGSAYDYHYKWSTGDTTDYIPFKGAGNYSVTVTDGTCTVTDAGTFAQINNNGTKDSSNYDFIKKEWRAETVFELIKPLPFGSPVLRDFHFKPSSENIYINNFFSDNEIFNCWAYYYLRISIDDDGSSVLPLLKFDSPIDVATEKSYYVTDLLDTIAGISAFYIYRLPDMGKYQVYYYAHDLNDHSFCIETVRAGYTDDCCTGAGYDCSTEGLLMFVDEKTKTAKVLEGYHFFSPEFSTSYWRYFYIPDNRHITIYSGDYEYWEGYDGEMPVHNMRLEEGYNITFDSAGEIKIAKVEYKLE